MDTEIPALQETVRVPVRFSEVDSAKIVWHGSYVAYLEDAREAFGRKYGLGYMDFIHNGYLAPIAQMHIDYKHPMSVNDVVLVHITYRHTLGAKLVFDYVIERESDGLLVLTATTTQLFTTIDGVFEVSCPDFLTRWKHRWDYD